MSGQGERMTLWRVTNGYAAASELFVLVLAPTAPRALELAGEVFKAESGGNYPEAFHTSLTAVAICMDASREWASGVES